MRRFWGDAMSLKASNRARNIRPGVSPMRKAKILECAALIPLFASQLALANPIQWSPTIGGNGHYYELVNATGLSWGAASIAAENRGGYLATPTSAAENSFI